MGSLRWLSHAAFEISSEGRVILIDPFLNENPLAPLKASDVSKADIVCVTHDHHDHLGDAIEICKKTGATFVGIAELSQYAQSTGVKNVVGMNIGGTAEIKGTKITMVPAFHSAGRGAPAGFVIAVGRSRIYHAGDTSLFHDMRTIGELYRPKIACLPVGGHYTMGPLEAAEAVRLIMPEVVIPMHYGTFPVLAPSADEFVSMLKEKGFGGKVVVLKPGESYAF
jgi:L-ascorbate metabolism protein UlaG (beta-lactamase superfamily)